MRQMPRAEPKQAIQLTQRKIANFLIDSQMPSSVFPQSIKESPFEESTFLFSIDLTKVWAAKMGTDMKTSDRKEVDEIMFDQFCVGDLVQVVCPFPRAVSHRCPNQLGLICRDYFVMGYGIAARFFRLFF